MENEFYEIILKIVKTWIINFLTIYTSMKIINKSNFAEKKIKKVIIEAVLISIITCIGIFVESISSKFYSIVYLILFLTFLLCKIEIINIGYALMVILISLGINYTLFSVAVIVS